MSLGASVREDFRLFEIAGVSLIWVMADDGKAEVSDVRSFRTLSVGRE